MKEMGKISTAWKSGNTNVKVGDGESPENVVERLVPAIKNVCKKYEQFLVVCHSHAIKSFLSFVSGIGLQNIHSLPQKNCGINIH